MCAQCTLVEGKMILIRILVTDNLLCFGLHVQWFGDHPRYLSNPFYIGGDSYAGKMTPLIAQYVSEGNFYGWMDQKQKGLVCTLSKKKRGIHFHEGNGSLMQTIYTMLQESKKCIIHLLISRHVISRVEMTTF